MVSKLNLSGIRFGDPPSDPPAPTTTTTTAAAAEEFREHASRTMQEEAPSRVIPDVPSLSGSDFDDFDANGDGVIDVEEFASAFNRGIRDLAKEEKGDKGKGGAEPPSVGAASQPVSLGDTGRETLVEHPEAVMNQYITDLRAREPPSPFTASPAPVPAPAIAKVVPPTPPSVPFDEDAPIQPRHPAKLQDALAAFALGAPGLMELPASEGIPQDLRTVERELPPSKAKAAAAKALPRHHGQCRHCGQEFAASARLTHEAQCQRTMATTKEAHQEPAKGGGKLAAVSKVAQDPVNYASPVTKKQAMPPSPGGGSQACEGKGPNWREKREMNAAAKKGRERRQSEPHPRHASPAPAGGPAKRERRGSLPSPARATTPQRLNEAKRMAGSIMRRADRHCRNKELTVNELRTFLRNTEFEAFSEWLSAPQSRNRAWKRHDADWSGALGLRELEGAVQAYLLHETPASTGTSTPSAREASPGAKRKPAKNPSQSAGGGYSIAEEARKMLQGHLPPRQQGSAAAGSRKRQESSPKPPNGTRESRREQRKPQVKEVFPAEDGGDEVEWGEENEAPLPTRVAFERPVELLVGKAGVLGSSPALNQYHSESKAASKPGAGVRPQQRQQQGNEAWSGRGNHIQDFLQEEKEEHTYADLAVQQMVDSNQDPLALLLAHNDARRKGEMLAAAAPVPPPAPRWAAWE